VDWIDVDQDRNKWQAGIVQVVFLPGSRMDCVSLDSERIGLFHTVQPAFGTYIHFRVFSVLFVQG